MRVNIYLSNETRPRVVRLAEIMNLPLSRLFAFLVEYYVRKEGINLMDE